MLKEKTNGKDKILKLVLQEYTNLKTNVYSYKNDMSLIEVEINKNIEIEGADVHCFIYDIKTTNIDKINKIYDKAIESINDIKNKHIEIIKELT